MENQDSYNKRRERAIDRMHELRAFYVHVMNFFIVSAVAIAVSFYFRGEIIFWLYFALGGWGFGVLMHGLKTYNQNWLLGKNWEERKVQQIMEEERRM